jgi:hypothetical protein
MLTDPHSILNWWRNNYQLLNVHGVNDVRQTEIHTTEPLVPQPGASEVEMVTEKLKTYKSPCTDQISELIQAGGRAVHSEIHEPTNYTWNKEEYQQQCTYL